MASLDIYRPAAQQQLKVLGDDNNIATLPVIMGEKPAAIAKRAMKSAAKEGFDVVILDTAGRLHIDEALMGRSGPRFAISSPRRKPCWFQMP